MAPALPPPVVVAVVSWNTRELLDACLRSLRPDVDEHRAAVWVVDNGSSDGSVELVRERHPWVNLIVSPENLGFGRAVNLVAARTTSSWIAPANSDVALEPGALVRMLAAGSEHPRAGAIAPRLLLSDGSTQHSVFAFPLLAFTMIYNLGLARIVPGLDERLCLPGGWDPERPRKIDWAMGAFLLVRREAWEETGGFDAGQWMYAEDLDLGWRLAQRGWQTRYEPGARVHHRASAATEQVWGDASADRWLSATYAWSLRRHGAPATRAIAAMNVLGSTLRYLARVPLARLRPERWSAGRDWFRDWARLHTIGLRPRAQLERQDHE